MQKVSVKMFGGFAFTYEGLTIEENDIKSDKLLKLMTYFLFNKSREIPSNELIDFLWSMEKVDNPIGALKNLVYRLRTLLKKKLNLQDFIVTGRSAYSINTDFEILLDTDRFESVQKQILSTPLPEFYDTIIEIYKGRFLPEIDNNQFVMSKSTYYHGIMMHILKDYCVLLENVGEYVKMESVASYAVELDELSEDAYELLIRALYNQNMYKEANKVYTDSVDLLYRKLGVSPSKKMNELYDLIQKQTHLENHSIYDIQKELDSKRPKGALLCEYGTFRELYNMQVRMMDRLGVSTHFCLLTVNDESEYNENKEKKRKYIEKTMQRMKQDLIDGLRLGDIVSRFSTNQYVVLLPSCTYEDARSVMKRVLKKINHTLNNKNIKIDLAVLEVTTSLKGDS